MIHSFTYAEKKNKDVGKVEKVRGSLAWVRGLKRTTVGEGISFENGVHGRVMAFESDLTKVMVLGREKLRPGEKAARTGSPLQISIGDGFLGKTVDYAGHLIEGEKEKSWDVEARLLETKGGKLSERMAIRDFLETGVVIVDLMVPLAKGQRELILGDRKSGKTHFALQALIAQVKKGSLGVMALIGKKRYEIKRIKGLLAKAGVLDKCVLVAAEAEASAGEVFMVPYTAMAIAEHFRDDGKDVLVVLDDLTTHAKRYRELSLVGGSFPGRDSYPGDIFYVHARLLERAGNFAIGAGQQAAITCLPLAETVEGNLTGYIQTNLMSMTDGHLFFDSNRFYKGQRPAIDVFISVTRVGRQVQSRKLKEASRKVAEILGEYAKLERFLKFGTELTERARKIVELNKKIQDLFKQVGYQVVLKEELEAKLETILK